MLLHKSICRADQVHLQEPIPGRLLHMRITQEASPTDLLVVYQHAWSIKPQATSTANQAPIQALLDRRRQLWTKIDT